MEIGEWVDRRKHRMLSRSKGINVKTDIEVEIAEVNHTGAEQLLDSRPLDTEMVDDEDDEEEDEESDDDGESEGNALNQRLLHAAAMRDQGVNVAMDPEWEQYLKEAQERGELNFDATREALRMMAGTLTQVNQAGSGAATSTQTYPPVAPA